MCDISDSGRGLFLQTAAVMSTALPPVFVTSQQVSVCAERM